MLNKREKLIVTGGSGGGKDYLLRQLEKEGLITSVKVTTRPQRLHEIEGKTYYFKSLDEFNSLLESNQFIVNQEFFNDKKELWKYGVLKEDFNKSQAFIMTPGEIAQIDTETRKGCFVVYLDIDRKIRESRILGRNDNNDSVTRRLDADEIDFKDFKDFDLKLTDPEFEVDLVIGLMY